MAASSLQKRVKIIEFYYASRRSIVTTQIKYCDHFNTATAPNAKTIRNLINRFEKLGSAFHRPPTNVHRRIRIDEALEVVRNSINKYASTHRRRATHLLTRNSLRRVLELVLKRPPYQIQLAQESLQRNSDQSSVSPVYVQMALYSHCLSKRGSNI